jgi:hypothetical protein
MGTEKQTAEFFEIALPYVLTCLGCVMTILITILLKKIGKIDELASQFQQHLLNFTQVLSKLVTSEGCEKTRLACLELNKTIIQAPLQKELNSHIIVSENRWREHEDEAEQLWLAVKNHVHTDQGVVVNDQRR